MMRLSLGLVALFFLSYQFSFAQTQAVTEAGDTVLLYDDGTWGLKKDSIETEVLANLIVAVSTESIAIDSTREVKTDAEVFFSMLSPRLARNFGEKGKIRCKVFGINNLGMIKLRFIWEIPVGDGDRYFGKFDEGKKVNFTLSNGQKMDFVMGDEAELQRYERNNYTVISNSTQPLTIEEITALVEQPITEVEVGWWKKKSETYGLEESSFIQNLLPMVF